MKHYPTALGFQFNLKTGHVLSFITNDTGSIFRIRTTTPKRKHRRGKERDIFLKRNTAAILAAVLMNELNCTTVTELNETIDYDQIHTLTP